MIKKITKQEQNWLNGYFGGCAYSMHVVNRLAEHVKTDKDAMQALKLIKILLTQEDIIE